MTRGGLETCGSGSARPATTPRNLITGNLWVRLCPAGHHTAESHHWKLLSPTRRRAAVAYLVRRHKVSERRACRVLGQHRSTQRYEPLPSDFEDRLVKAMWSLAEAHPRWGYRQIWGLLVEDGWAVNRKRVERLWRREGMRVAPLKSKTSGKKAGGSAKNSIWNFPALFVDHVWTIDFVTDYTVHGAQFRSFNVLDEYTRYFVGARVARSIGARSVRAFFEIVFEREGRPKFLRADIHPEWCRDWPVVVRPAA
jgi:putative transposase